MNLQTPVVRARYARWRVRRRATIATNKGRIKIISSQRRRYTGHHFVLKKLNHKMTCAYIVAYSQLKTVQGFQD